MHQDDRKRMFAAAKLTVRAYAKDPSDNNAARVQVAWRAVSDMKTRSFWRQWQEARARAQRQPNLLTSAPSIRSIRRSHTDMDEDLANIIRAKHAQDNSVP